MRDTTIDPNTFDYSLVAARLAIIIPQLRDEMAIHSLRSYHMHGVWQRRWGKTELFLKVFDRRGRKEIPYYAIKELHRAIRLGEKYYPDNRYAPAVRVSGEEHQEGEAPTGKPSVGTLD